MSNYCGSRIQGFAPPTGAILLATKRPQSDTGLWINSAVCGDPFAKRATRSVLSANGRPNPDSTTHRYSDVTARQRKNFLGKFATVHDSKLTTQPSICLQNYKGRPRRRLHHRQCDHLDGIREDKPPQRDAYRHLHWRFGRNCCWSGCQRPRRRIEPNRRAAAAFRPGTDWPQHCGWRRILGPAPIVVKAMCQASPWTACHPAYAGALCRKPLCAELKKLSLFNGPYSASWPCQIHLFTV